MTTRTSTANIMDTDNRTCRGIGSSYSNITDGSIGAECGIGIGNSWIMRTVKDVTRLALSVMLALSFVFGASQASVYADDRDVSLTMVGEVKNETVAAKFTVTRQTIIDLGYDTVVSIPVEIGLTLNTTTKVFEGSGNVTAYGVLDEDQAVTVEIKDTDAAYGVINGPDSFSRNLKEKGFGVTLSKKKWTPDECYDNLEKKTDGEALTQANVGTLAVSVPGTRFVPRYLDDYTTTIPLMISLVTE